MNPDITKTLSGAIHFELERQTKLIVEEEAKLASERVIDRVRGMTGQIVTKVVQLADFKRLEDRIIITVRIPDKEGL